MPAGSLPDADAFPVRLAKGLANGLYRAVTLPGDVRQGKVPMYGEDGHTNLEVMHRAADLAGVTTMGSLAGIPENALASGFARMRVNPLEQADLARELAVLRRNQGFA